MQIREFVPLAVRTESRVEHVNISSTQLAQLMHLCIATGTVADLFKKHLFYNKCINSGDVTEMLDTVIHLATSLRNNLPTNTVTEKTSGINTRLLHASLGTYTESTEMLQALLAAWLSGDPVDAVNFAEECFGDLSWYQAIASDALQLSWENFLDAVIAKLQKRYPEKFTNELANSRDLVAERAILESGFAASAKS